MKVYGTLLALCVFHPTVWGTTAFLVQAPKALTSKGWKTTDALTPAFSYLGNLGKLGGDSKEGGASEKPASKINNPSVSTVGEGRTVRSPRLPSLFTTRKLIVLDVFLKRLIAFNHKSRHREPWKRALMPSKAVAALPVAGTPINNPRRGWIRLHQ